MISQLINKILKIVTIFYLLTKTSIASECELENQMISAGLMDISKKDTSIQVGIYNATTKNMIGINSYGCLTKCYLQPDAIDKLIIAQKELKKLNPSFSLKILEGTRPRSVQKKMYDAVKNTSIKAYVANPATGSMHNYGMAIDLTIIDSLGNELNMGKPDPRIKIIGKSDFEIKIAFLLNNPNKMQMKNRELLKSVMTKAGFFPLKHEWWHFEAAQKDYIRKHYKMID